MKTFKKLFVAVSVGVLLVGAALAGVISAPVKNLDAPNLASDLSETLEDARVGSINSTVLGADELLVGAAKVSLEPAPDTANGEVWEKEGCATLGGDAPDLLLENADHVADFRVRWPEKQGCIYMGGYGIGPMNPITSWSDPYGLYARSVYVSDGSESVVLTSIDAVYWFGKYGNLCDGCGAFDLAQQLGAELDMDPASFVFAATHSHTSPDFIGGWGGAPEWYFDQVAEAMRNSVRRAVAAARPAVLVAGDTLVRERNGERRDTYRSAEDPTLSWFRAIDSDQETIVTVGTYAAHAVTADEGAGIADADFPGVFAAEVSARFGGEGILFEGGLGNMSPRGNKLVMGSGLAAAIPDAGKLVTAPDVRVDQEFFDVPITNSGLLALGTPGFFDRPFNAFPVQVAVGKSDVKKCVSASPVSVNTAVTAARIGDVLAVTSAPGEIFANISNTFKEQAPVVLTLGAANDGLGYIIQEFETDDAARQVTGFVGANVVEYEDAYSIDRCFGDLVVEKTRNLLNGL